MCVTRALPFQVLAATSLRPTDLQGYSDPYCVCYLKIPDSGEVSIDGRFRGQRGETYFVEKTLNPKWSGQRFVFKVLCVHIHIYTEYILFYWYGSHAYTYIGTDMY